MLNFNIDDFLKHYWQQKPLLIRSAFPNYQSPITAEDLAGLSCEDFVESRIIIENSSTPKWSLENGPFPESRFTQLPENNWTLLIQGLNKIFPEIDDLLHQFNFIPTWRVDDVMASYAAPGGSVGPHLDQYDVFLLQVSGKRKWMINAKQNHEELIDDKIPLKLINNFEAESEWILDAGDMLYLPANVAHHGIGMENCMTFSIGFRAPSHQEMLTAYVDDHINEHNEKLRYQDPVLSSSNQCGEISNEAITQLQEILVSQFSDKEKIADWFGQFITDYLNDHENIDVEHLEPSDFLIKFKKFGPLRRPATVRANYYINSKNKISLYINGIKQNTIPTTEAIITLFCDQNIINYNDVESKLSDNHSVEFLCQLYNQGYIELQNE